MKNVCKGFAAGNAAFHKNLLERRPFRTGEIPPSTQRLLTFPLEEDLVLVMSAFVELLEAREEADYDTTKTWNRMSVSTKIELVQGAFIAWSNIKTSSNAKVFKAALLLQKNWGR
jgi:hypothetical protein